MTLSERNIFFKAGIIFCAVCALLILAASFITIPLYQEAGYIPLTASDVLPVSDVSLSADDPPEEEGYSPPLKAAQRRPQNFFHSITNKIAANNYYAVHTALSLLAIFSLAGIFLIHYYFERTSAPEILYIAFFTISFSFEAIRLVIPLQLALNFPSVYILAAAKILLFVRFFGIFSLFAASICSSGLEVQKIRNVIFALIISAMAVTMGVPIDVLNWNTSFNMVNGYSSMFAVIEIVVFITTMISFLITAKNRFSREYIYVAAGITIALIGRNFLLNTDNWAGLVPGIFLLSFGTWMMCSKLHKIHLWL